MDQEAIISGNLATEANLIVLDLLETIVQVTTCTHAISQHTDTESRNIANVRLIIWHLVIYCNYYFAYAERPAGSAYPIQIIIRYVWIIGTPTKFLIRNLTKPRSTFFKLAGKHLVLAKQKFFYFRVEVENK